jgi:hypothetical protein
MPNNSYNYMGSAHWGNQKRTCFLTPIFRLGQEFFVQNISENDTVANFEKVQLTKPDSLIHPSNALKLKIGDQAFFCFNVKGKSQIEGTRSEITKDLMTLLFSTDQINVHSKFLIANFLKLYSLQFELLKEVNNDLKSKGVDSINQEVIYEEIYEREQTLDLTWVLEKYRSLKEMCQQIVEHDLIFIHGQTVFFDNARFSLATVCNKMATENKEFDSLLANSLKKSKELLDTEDSQLIESNLNVTEYMTCSSYYFKNDKKLAQSLINMEAAVTGSEIVTLGSDLENKFIAGYNIQSADEMDVAQVNRLASQFSKVTGGFNLE